MKVLLVNTNRMKPAIAPIGLDYLADSLVAAGHDLRLLDLCFSEDLAGDIAQTAREFSPEASGVTVRNTDDCYFTSRAFFLAEIKEVIDRFRQISDAPIVLGGIGFSVAPVAALDYCEADFGIVGEGERALVEWLQALERGAGFECVPNLVYRQGAFIRQNPVVPLDLAALPARKRAWIDNARYFAKGGQAGFESKRGCSMSCIYCAEPAAKGPTVRLMPPERVVAELATLVGQGIDQFHTCDSEFNIPDHHALAICQAIIDARLGDQIRWFAYCSPIPFDDAMALLFRRAGCAGIDFGADSGCDEMLRRLGRPFATVDLERTARICRRHGLPVMYDLLIGGPGETRATVRQTIEFVRGIGVDCVGLSMGLRVYEGTPMARQIRAAGDPAAHPNLYGAKQHNPHFLKPVYYISPDLGEGMAAYVREQVAGDSRFFLPADSTENRNYNYNDNTVLVRAIEYGARGAYWDILRRLRERS